MLIDLKNLIHLLPLKTYKKSGIKNLPLCNFHKFKISTHGWNTLVQMKLSSSGYNDNGFKP
jgi:hypothetical protein